MTSSVLCRYYLQGACAFGDKCRFSHSKEQDEPSQVCRYYLAGNCAYGDKCRYQHSKPGWSGKGQPAPASNYSAPSGVPRPPVGSGSGSGNMVKLPSGASEFGMVEAAPNWDDYMTPDEMDEFEQWQTEQANAAATRWDQQGEYDEGDIMDPAEIPLCNEYAAQGYCSAGEECCYIHGDLCEICGYYCIHPYNPDVTAHHQMVCSEAMAAAAGGTNSNTCNGSSAPPPPAKAEPAAPPAAAAQDGKKEKTAAAERGAAKPDAAAAAAAAADAADAAAVGSEKEDKAGEAAAAADAAADEATPADGDAAAATADAVDELADKVAEVKVSS